ncbi:MAG TPA: hypothetical protein VGD69_25485, partial [Herpetosiphonaceae bacterium]
GLAMQRRDAAATQRDAGIGGWWAQLVDLTRTRTPASQEQEFLRPTAAAGTSEVGPPIPPTSTDITTPHPSRVMAVAHTPGVPP